MDKNSAHYAGENINMLPMIASYLRFDEYARLNIWIIRLNRIIALFKKISRPMTDFKAFHLAKATIDRSETTYISWKWRLSEENIPSYKLFIALAG